MAKRIRYTEEQLSAMAEKYNNGRTLKQLSVDYKVSIPTIRKNLENSGVDIRPVGRPKIKGTMIPNKKAVEKPVLSW